MEISRASFTWKPDSKPSGFQSACRGHSRSSDTILIYKPLKVAVATLHTNPWHVAAKDRFVLTVSSLARPGLTNSIVETLDDRDKSFVRGITLGRRFLNQLLNPSSPYRWIVQRCTNGPLSIIGVFDNLSDAEQAAKDWQGSILTLGESLTL
jgi:hypothetical protein